jgi:hypothetical protein
MMKRVAILFALMFALAYGAAQAQSQHEIPKIFQRESGAEEIKYQGSKEILFNISWTIERYEESGRQLVSYKATGDNNKQGETRIDWTEDSLVEISTQGLLTQHWKKVSNGAEQMTWSLVFDWIKREAQYSWEDRVSGKKKERTLSLANNAIASNMIDLFVRGFPFEKGPGTKVQIQLINIDGDLTNGDLYFRGELEYFLSGGSDDRRTGETTKGESRTFQLYVIEFVPTGIAGLLKVDCPPPSMLVSKSEPHLVLRSRAGCVTGLGPRRQSKSLKKYEPAEIMNEFLLKDDNAIIDWEKMP